MMKLKGSFYVSAVLAAYVMLFSPAPVLAQKTLVYENPHHLYSQGLELFDKEKYAAAQNYFLQYAQVTRERESRINAEYYAGVCAMELFNADAINLLTDIFTSYPEHPKAKLAVFQLGKYYYRTKDNKRAIQYFEQVEAVALTQDEAAEYWFMKGYCYFKTDRFDDSKNAFKNIKDQQGKYYDASNYYYGYVCYRQLNYDEALAHFERIKQSRTFGPLSQVYIAQILFSRKQYQQVVAFADSISNKEIIDDVAGIVGQSYFYLGSYDKALPFLEKYNANPPVDKTNKDVYRLGYTYQATGDYAKAIEQLTSITGEKDTTSQFANYHLAECYLKTDQKQSALLAFDRSYKLGFDQQITELSLFNYAKLSYELNRPDALKDLVKFVNDYAESPYVDEAKTFLSTLLMSTRNYKEAIRIIESIKKPSEDNLTAYQRVLYYRAEELYLNNDYTGSEELFKKSMQKQYDKKLYALAHFWLGELAFKQGRYNEAYQSYTSFQQHDEIKDTRFYPLSFYNKGYCRIKTEQYDEAIALFKQFVEMPYATASPELLTDATMRMADCNFVLKNYEKAISYYDVIVTKKMNGSDYALYQKAMIYGVLNKPQQKTEALRQIVDQHKRSPFIDDALFEIGNVHLQSENYTAAQATFQEIIDNYPRSVYIRKAHLNKGLAYYNNNNDDKALAEFKILAVDFCNTDEAKQALVIVKNIYVNKGESEEYLEFIRSASCVVVSPSYQDSVSYESAFNMYKSDDCTKASKLFKNYITRFPGGYFILKANYYKAECDFKLKNYDTALVHYEFVATHNRNDFTERSTRQTAILYYNKKNYEKAYEYYSALERIAGNRDNLQVALAGQMKSGMQLNKIDTTASASFKYINSTLIRKEDLVDANLNIGRYFMAHDQPDSALTAFQYVLKETKNAYAAESKYNIAYINYLRKEYNTAKKQIFELSDKFPSYEGWIAKGYLVLADIYHQQKDNFQAKATLQSLIENLDDGDPVKDKATERLRQIIGEEEQNKPLPKPQTEKEIQKL